MKRRVGYGCGGACTSKSTASGCGRRWVLPHARPRPDKTPPVVFLGCADIVSCAFLPFLCARFPCRCCCTWLIVAERPVKPAGNMILPVIVNDGQTPPPADALTTRLAALSELVIQLPSGGGAGVVAGFKAFLGEFGCRVGPFNVLEGDREAEASGRFSCCWLC